MDVTDEQLDTLGRAVLGMTLGCARCHDHKFDPIPTRDYYALAGIFRSTAWLEHENVSRWTERPLPVEPDVAAQLKSHDEKIAAVDREIAQLKSPAEGAVGANAPPLRTLTTEENAKLKQLQSRLQKLKAAAPYRPATMAVSDAAKIEDC